MKIEALLSLARSARGSGASALIVQALQSGVIAVNNVSMDDMAFRVDAQQACWLFAELLQEPSIQALRDDKDHSIAYRLLELFTFGAFESLQSDAVLSAHPLVSNAMRYKLRLLSLVSMASVQPILSYDAIIQKLQLSNDSQVEALVAEAVSCDLMSAILDQLERTVTIEKVQLMRDARPESVPEMLSFLVAWYFETFSKFIFRKEQIEQVHQTLSFACQYIDQNVQIRNKEEQDFLAALEKAAPESRNPARRNVIAGSSRGRR